MVRTFGYRTVAFESATDLLSSTECEYPGCILLDIWLPDIDGLQVQGLLRRKGCKLPIVYMSGDGELLTRNEVIKQGEIDFMTKPFAPEVLQDAITQAIARNKK